MKTNSNWEVSFSQLRTAACIAIIILHTVTYALVAVNTQGVPLSASKELGAALVQYSQMWAVPVFVMVTGALLLDPSKEIPFARLWKRYIARIGKALLGFGLLFIVFDLALNGAAETAENSPFFEAHPGAFDTADRVSVPYVFFCRVADLLTGHSWAHMWYLYMLLGLYLLLPFYKKIAANSSPGELRYLLGIYGFFVCLVPLTSLGGMTADFRFSVATIYPFYLFLGYVLQNRILPVPRWLAVLLLVCSSVGIWAGVFLLRADQSEVLSYLTSYNSVPVVLQAGSLFALVAPHRSDAKAHKLLLAFDHCTFGIYLVHLVFIKLLLRYAGLTPFEHLWEFPVVVLAVTLLSFGVTEGYYQLKKALKKRSRS